MSKKNYNNLIDTLQNGFDKFLCEATQIQLLDASLILQRVQETLHNSILEKDFFFKFLDPIYQCLEN